MPLETLDLQALDYVATRRQSENHSIALHGPEYHLTELQSKVLCRKLWQNGSILNGIGEKPGTMRTVYKMHVMPSVHQHRTKLAAP